jgi:hypothetical protein
MIGARTIRNLFDLRRTEPFSRLDDDELLLIAKHARHRSFAPGRIIIPAGGVADALFVRVTGAATVAEAVAPAVFDPQGLLFGTPARGDYLAGPDGLAALTIAKPHLFTIARECPEFVIGLRDLAEAAGT